jgi:diguanylate cyclase (GGDEF)-like protein
MVKTVLSAEYVRPVPFFNRLGVKHGIILSLLVLLAMAVLTAEQLRETLREIRRNAVDRGHGVASAVAPLILPALKAGDLMKLQVYFDRIAASKEISYVQIVNRDGTVEITSNPTLGDHPPRPLKSNWLYVLNAEDRTAVDVPWDEGNPGVDVFVALLDRPGQATEDDLHTAKHLRIGVNFDRMVRDDTPRVIAQMVYFTLVVGFIMVMGLVILLTYIMNPLRQLRLGFMAVAAGDLEYRVPVQTKDEVGQVVQLFNATIERLRLAFHEIEALARRDPLTGLPNRRAFDERLSAEAARSRRYGHPFGIIILDLDHFKSVNDRFGHPAGDEVLKFVAKTIEANVRETDLAARIGGEEFAVILPESGMDEVKAVSEKLRESVGECSFKPVQGLPEGMRITISAGGAGSAGHLVTPESIVAAADAALFRSKNEGRNRVTVAPSLAGKTSMLPSINDPRKDSDVSSAL